MKKKHPKRNYVLAAMMAALGCGVTMFLHIPTHQGYIHVGDAVFFLAAVLLPGPYAAAAAAIGGGLSDLLSGYPLWILPTMLIKAGSTLAFTSRKETCLHSRNWLALGLAGVWCVGGYFAAGILLAMFSGAQGAAALAAAAADIPGNCVQTLASSLLFVAVAFSLDRTGMKKRLTLHAN